jgi:hypothetical protein
MPIGRIGGDGHCVSRWWVKGGKPQAELFVCPLPTVRLNNSARPAVLQIGTKDPIRGATGEVFTRVPSSLMAALL